MDTDDDPRETSPGKEPCDDEAAPVLPSKRELPEDGDNDLSNSEQSEHQNQRDQQLEDHEEEDEATPPPPPPVKRRKFFAKDEESESEVRVSDDVVNIVESASRLDKGKGRAIDQDEVVEILDDTDDDDDNGLLAAGPSSEYQWDEESRPRVPRDGKEFTGDRYFGTFTARAFATSSTKNSEKDFFKQSKLVKLERPVVSAITQKKLANASVSVRERAEDAIVRLRNSQDREIGRILQKDANWMAKAMDLGLARFEARVADAPKVLNTGLTEFNISVRTYIYRDAFVSHQIAAKGSARVKDANGKDKEDKKQKSKSKGKGVFVVDETVDTEMEYILKRRKVAIKHLLSKLKMKPVLRGEAVQRLKTRSKEGVRDFYSEKSGKGKKATGAEQSKSVNSGSNGKDMVKTEEGEVEDTEMSKGEVAGVLSRASRMHHDLPQMDPPPHFSLQLRPYQKQALRWMCDKERGIEDEEQQTKIHPLWAEYIFPAADNVIDLDEEDEPFFYNEFSGELSLSFPKGGSTVPGGILADEMGLGKTIMIAALIHTNYATASGNSRAASSASSSAESDASHNSKDADSDQSDMPRHPISDNKRQIVSKRVSGRNNATLVVAPTSLLNQWKDELRRTSKDRLSVLVYNDSKDISHLKDELDGGVDVVVVSYGKVGVEYENLTNGKGNRKAKDGLYAINWYRIILDEAHNIKSRSTRAAKACFALTAQRRWCLSGTPIVNRLEDLFSLVHFLKAEPYGIWAFFKTFVTIPFQNKDASAAKIVEEIMSSLLLRREKSMKDKDGNPIVPLPQKIYQEDTLYLSRDERAIYDKVEEESKKRFRTFEESGTVKSNTIAILAMITRLRQACLHPALLFKAGNKQADPSGIVVRKMVAKWMAEGNRSVSPEKVLEDLNEEDEDFQPQCMICQDLCEEAVFLPCEHSACKQCILAYLTEENDNQAECPACADGQMYSVDDLHQAVRRTQTTSETASKDVIDLSDGSGSDTEDVVQRNRPEPLFRERSASSSSSEAPRTISNTRHSSTSDASVHDEAVTSGNWLERSDFVPSTKINAVIKHLLDVKSQEPKFHAVVFSQFTSFLDLFEQALNIAKLRFVRLDGSMDRRQREASIRSFNDKTKHCVFIISLKAGGTGLNLTLANRIYLTDWWWNRAIENQAIDRVHRFGQEREVFVHRFRVERSIEGKMKAIQERKSKVINASLGGEQDASNMQEQYAAIFADN